MVEKLWTVMESAASSAGANVARLPKPLCSHNPPRVGTVVPLKCNEVPTCTKRVQAFVDLLPERQPCGRSGTRGAGGQQYKQYSGCR